METIKHLADLVLHLDKTLPDLVNQVGPWIYLILFGIVFCETGLVVLPFLPGDSLLFAAGALAGGAFGGDWLPDVWAIMGVLIIAALCGDNLNYFIGRKMGPQVFKRDDSRWLKKKHLDRTHRFFERYGGKTIIIARFVPVVRTFTPFVAGVGRMEYFKFLKFSIAGAVLWVLSLVMVGYWFGKREFVKNNFSTVIIAIIAISLLPAIIELLKARRHAADDATTRRAKSLEEQP